MLLLAALLAPAVDLFFPAGWRPPRERRTVVIERGQSLHVIARELQRVGVIKSQVGFLVLARAMRLDRRVKAGQYSFRLGTTVPALLRALDRGMYGLNLVTIPEGLMIRETARIIQAQVGIPAAALDSLSRDPALLDSLEIGAPSLEGWLAPDSYEWLPGTSPEVVLRTMVTRTRERVERATAGYDSLPLGMNAHELLTLASIVESESRANHERPRIARVYLNRLERGMLLQADPTVGYALGRGPRSRLLYRDLRVESPYNTYRHEGLPPGPICSPGEAAIQAVMNAQPGIHDLYFVANGKGTHIFAPTYQQHLANIAFVKSKMKAEAAAAAAAAKRAIAEDEEEVVSGAAGDSALAPSGTAASPGAAPAKPAGASGSGTKAAVAHADTGTRSGPAAPATNLAAKPGAPGAGSVATRPAGATADSAAKPRPATATATTAPRPTTASGTTPKPTSATATSVEKPAAGATAAGSRPSAGASKPASPAATASAKPKTAPAAGPSKPATSSAAGKPAAASATATPKPASPPSASAPQPAPLKGSLLAPKGATVASSSPNTATVVKPAARPAKPDTAKAPARKPAAPKPSSTENKGGGE
jgi:UPF0755 protein